MPLTVRKRERKRDSERERERKRETDRESESNSRFLTTTTIATYSPANAKRIHFRAHPEWVSSSSSKRIRQPNEEEECRGGRGIE